MIHFNPPAPCGAGPPGGGPGGAPGDFNPPAPCGAGRLVRLSTPDESLFQSTRPVRGGTTAHRLMAAGSAHFNPPAPCGAGQPKLINKGDKQVYFNPPAPCGAGRQLRLWGLSIVTFQSTRPVRGGTLPVASLTLLEDISIHPPRAGRDIVVSAARGHLGDFNPPAPCGAGLGGACLRLYLGQFQSTRPVRGGTTARTAPMVKQTFQSTRPVRGGTLWCPPHVDIWGISIHPPRAGRDISRRMKSRFNSYFNPPAPCGAGRGKDPRALQMIYFNPPAPCGAGPGKIPACIKQRCLFQSTRPVRGGTAQLQG